MNDVAEKQESRELERTRPSRIEVMSPVPMLDTGQFEQMKRIASAMANASLIPDALCKGKDDDNKAVWLPYERVLANCFLIVNQAVRWGMDPFAVASSVAVVHGKLCYEGKLVAAALDAKLGIKLHHHFDGDSTKEAYRVFISDRPFTEEIIARLEPGFSPPGWRIWDGSVAEWKTTGNNSPWSPKNYRRMLIYRGNRDWCRIYESALMLGVYTDDEMDDLSHDARASRARVVGSSGIADRLAGPNGGGFNADNIETETGGARGAVEKQAAAREVVDEDGVVTKSSYQDAEAKKQETDDQLRSADIAPPAEDKGSSDEAAEQSAAKPEKGKGGSADKASAQDQNSAEKSPSSAEKTESSTSTKVRQDASVTLEDKTLRAYNDALWQAKSAEDLGKAKEEFWKNRARPNDERDIETLRSVFVLHGKFQKQEISRDDLMRDLAEILPDEELEL